MAEVIVDFKLQIELRSSDSDNVWERMGDWVWKRSTWLSEIL